MSERRVIGFIGGSGLYALDAIRDARQETIATPWGEPSGPLTLGRIGDVDVVFLARHGEGHVLTPASVNYRANIDAMKRAGVTDLVSISACGSFREELPPGMFVMVDQFIDRTSGRASSFFGPGFVAHVSMAYPVCPLLSGALAAAAEALGVPCRKGGVYVCIDGPQFSSRAESLLYKSWGADVIGMTNMPEAKLAREAELPFATVAMVTDYDCWREHEAHVDVASVLEVMRANTEHAKRLVVEVASRLGPVRTPSPLGVERCLDAAVITPRSHWSADMIERLSAVAGRLFD